MFDTNNELDAEIVEINMLENSHYNFRIVFKLSPLYDATMKSSSFSIYRQKFLHGGKNAYAFSFISISTRRRIEPPDTL